jgi:hypothetical protein
MYKERANADRYRARNERGKSGYQVASATSDYDQSHGRCQEEGCYSGRTGDDKDNVLGLYQGTPRLRRHVC